MKYTFAFISVLLWCAASIAQSSPSPSTNGADQAPAQSQSSQPATQPQQPASMQPGTVPPTEPQMTAPQSSAPAVAPSTAQPGALRIAAGSVIPVQLSKTVDAKKAKAGDEVIAKVTMDMKSNSGDVLVPKDTTVIGHVTEAQARNKEQKESQVGITFDTAKMKSGDMQLPMSIQAIIAPPSASPNSGDNGGGGYDQGVPAAGGATATSSMGGGRSSSGSSPSQPPAPNAVPTTGSNPQTGDTKRPNITGNTQGVIGLPNLKLEATTANTTQGSVVTSEKGNVKLESGTLMLLRVSQ